MVDVGNDWLKIAVAEPTRPAPRVTRLYLAKLGPASTPSSGLVVDAIRDMKISGVPVIACLPRQVVNIRNLELPSTDAAEIADMVDLQAGKLTPYSKDEIVYDYRVLGKGREGYSRVMLVIVQRSVLREKYQLLEEAGLTVGRMSVSTEGLLNWAASFPGAADAGTLALLDVDSFYTELAVVRDGVLVFSRSILIGANQLVAGDEQATAKLMEEARRSLDICRSEHHGVAPDRVLATGAAVRIEGIDRRLGEALDLPCESADPVEALSSLPETPSLGSEEYRPVSLTPLVGMALSPDSLQFDLVPDTVTLKRNLVDKARALTTLGILVMAALLSASLYGSGRYLAGGGRLKSLRAECEKTLPAVQRINRMQEIIDVVEKRQGRRMSSLVVLAELQQCRLPGVDVQSANMVLEKGGGETGFVIGAMTADVRLITAFVQRLEQSPLFVGAKESGMRKDPASGKFRFQVAGSLEGGE